MLNSQKIKNFRNQNVIKSFYKFILKHDLREKALLLLVSHVKQSGQKLDPLNEVHYEDLENLS